MLWDQIRREATGRSILQHLMRVARKDTDRKPLAHL
jgi:hypothetical protein